MLQLLDTQSSNNCSSLSSVMDSVTPSVHLDSIFILVIFTYMFFSIAVFTLHSYHKNTQRFHCVPHWRNPLIHLKSGHKEAGRQHSIRCLPKEDSMASLSKTPAAAQVLKVMFCTVTHRDSSCFQIVPTASRSCLILIFLYPAHFEIYTEMLTSTRSPPCHSVDSLLQMHSSLCAKLIWQWQM